MLDETRKKLQTYSDRYKLIVSTSQKPAVESNVFLFTAERVVEYQLFDSVDFFVIDEFYKLSPDRDDERAIVLNHALLKLTRLTQTFYMLGPVVASVPVQFHDRYRFRWVHSDYQTVAVDEIDVDAPKRARDRFDKLYELLDIIDGQTLVYCSSRPRAERAALGYAEHLSVNTPNAAASDPRLEPAAEWIRDNIHEDWGMLKCLEHGAAFHHGAIPRHLGSSIVDLFNREAVRVLFCTTTLIEGVNTAARNVVLFDKKKGLKSLDYFDYRNIAGRSGRMSRFFVGHVYRFDREPDQLELDVDIPVVTQTEAPIELLVQLAPDHIVQDRRTELDEFYQLDPVLQDVIRSNSGISVAGQAAAVDDIRDNASRLHPMIAWTGIPSYNELLTCCELIWQHLAPENKSQVASAAQLAVLTKKYSQFKSIRALVSDSVNERYWIDRIPNHNDRVNNRTGFVLNVVRNWFDFRLPKLLGVLSSLQEYAFASLGLSAGDYTFYAGQIENNSLPAGLSAVGEYDVPASALRKIANAIPSDATIDEIIAEIRGLNLAVFGLTEYERQKLSQV